MFSEYFGTGNERWCKEKIITHNILIQAVLQPILSLNNNSWLP